MFVLTATARAEAAGKVLILVSSEGRDQGKTRPGFDFDGWEMPQRRCGRRAEGACGQTEGLRHEVDRWLRRHHGRRIGFKTERLLLGFGMMELAAMHVSSRRQEMAMVQAELQLGRNSAARTRTERVLTTGRPISPHASCGRQ